jgi:hypothetical protein
VIKFVSDLRQVGGFSAGPPVSSTNKTDRHDIAEILLKVALNTISNKQTNNQTIVEILSLLVNSGEQIINCRLKQGDGKT